MGFLIDAVATWFGFVRLPQGKRMGSGGVVHNIDYLAEFNNRMIGSDPEFQGCRWWCGLSSVR